jgi:hypothetical protein
LGDFSDAYDEGQKAKQTQKEREQQERAARIHASNDALAAAKAWAPNNLLPMIEEARRDLVGKGSVVIRETQIAMGSRMVSRHEIHIEMIGKPPLMLAFAVHNDGSVEAYRNRSTGGTLGHITNVGPVQLKQLLLKELREIKA